MSIEDDEQVKKILLPNNTEIETTQGVVIVGANGSGKTRLGNWIDTQSEQKNISHRISAQKIINIPESISSIAVDKALASLLCGNQEAEPEQFALFKVGQKWGNEPATYTLNDYQKLLVYLFSEYNEVSSRYMLDSIKSEQKISPPETKLLAAKKIWEEIMPHRNLDIGGGSIHASLKEPTISRYNASKMSDGERVALYLIGQCLSAPQNSIIVIDEPELHLHKSIQYALWDRIENERSDCLFVYLTHDVEFAVSRVNMPKVWLKDYDGTQWKWEIIENNTNLPEELLIEVYGSRKKTLLIEGENGSHDVQLYRNVFKDFLVRPCGSCENVIAYTKAFNDNKEFHQLDIYGLIDKDRRSSEEISSLADNGIFVLEVAEVEHIFATPEMLKIVAKNLHLDFDNKFTDVKNFVFEQLNNEIENQISERTVEELKQKLAKYDLQGKSKESINEKYSQLKKDIDLDSIYDSVKDKFDEIILTKDYNKLLAYYNRKTIASRIGAIFGLKDNELPALLTRLISNNEYKKLIIEAVSGYIPNNLSVLIEK